MRSEDPQRYGRLLEQAAGGRAWEAEDDPDAMVAILLGVAEEQGIALSELSTRVGAIPDRESRPGRLPWEPRTDDVGLRIVDGIGHSLSLDDEWATRTDRGFTWWGKDLAQHVWAEPAVDDDGLEVFRLHARTDLFRDFKSTPDDLTKLNALLAAYATTSGLLINEESGQVQFAASMYAHAESEDWVRRTFQLVVAMQAADAQIKADNLATPMGFAVAASAHPTSGPRPDYDDMLSMLEQVAGVGQQPSMWKGDDMEATTMAVQRASSTVLATGDASGISAEFPFQSRTSLLTVTTDAPNPQLGNGVLLLLHLPMTIAESDEGVRFAAELTRRELASMTRAHYLGSWCWRDDGMHFVSFLPNMMYLGGSMLLNVVISMAARAKWVAESFYGDDWMKNRDTYGRPLATPALSDFTTQLRNAAREDE